MQQNLPSDSPLNARGKFKGTPAWHLPFHLQNVREHFSQKRQQKQRRDIFFQADYASPLAALMVSGANVIFPGKEEALEKVQFLRYLVRFRTNR